MYKGPISVLKKGVFLGKKGVVKNFSRGFTPRPPFFHTRGLGPPRVFRLELPLSESAKYFKFLITSAWGIAAGAPEARGQRGQLPPALTPRGQPGQLSALVNMPLQVYRAMYDLPLSDLLKRWRNKHSNQACEVYQHSVAYLYPPQFPETFTIFTFYNKKPS